MTQATLDDLLQTVNTLVASIPALISGNSGGQASNLTDSLTGHSGASFSTKDRDNDTDDGNCALIYLGAWWYSPVKGICHYVNLNGYNYNRRDLPHVNSHFGTGINWLNQGKVAEQDYYFSWPKVEMKMRKIF